MLLQRNLIKRVYNCTVQIRSWVAWRPLWRSNNCSSVSHCAESCVTCRVACSIGLCWITFASRE